MIHEIAPSEERALKQIAEKIRKLRKVLNDYELVTGSTHPKRWYRFLKRVKGTLGNLNNDVSFVATLLANDYLVRRHGPPLFGAASKSQSVPGLVSTSPRRTGTGSWAR